MNEIQKKTMELLKELDCICRSSGITYFLAPGTLALFHVYRGHSPYSVNLNILVPAGQILRLADILSERKDDRRELQYMGNYSRHADYQLLYVDRTTTFIDLRQGWNNRAFGARIVITPLRNEISGIRKTILGVLETGWECNGYRLTGKLRPKRIISMAAVRAAMIAGRGRLARCLFRTSMKVYGSAMPDSGELVIRRPKRRSRYVDAGFFRDTEDIIIDGHKFCVPADPAGFLSAYYGPDWIEKTMERRPSYKGTVMSGRVPYEEYLRRCDEVGCGISSLFRNQRSDLLAGATVIGAFRARAKALNIAKRSGDRLHVYERLRADHEEIERLYRKGDLDRLSEIFAENEEMTLKYMKKGLGFCACREYMDIQCELFRYRGEDELADRLVKLAPSAHYSPLGKDGSGNESK